MLPPLDGRWWMTDGYSYTLHPAQQAFRKMVRLIYEDKLGLPAPEEFAPGEPRQLTDGSGAATGEE